MPKSEAVKAIGLGSPTVFSLMLGVSLFAVVPTLAQQVTCSPSVAPEICKQFDSSFGTTSMWPRTSFTKRVQIVITDPAQFKIEKATLKDEINAVTTKWRPGDGVGVLNRAGGRMAGQGVFDYEILECANSVGVTRIVISTEAVGTSVGSSTPDEISQQLLFYLAGYSQGLQQGVAGMQP